MHAQHCAQSCPVRSSSDTGSVLGTAGSMDEVSQLIFSENDDSDFGYSGLHKHEAYLRVFNFLSAIGLRPLRVFIFLDACIYMI